MPVRQNPWGAELEAEGTEVRIGLHLFRELISERSIRRFALHRKIPRGLIVNRDLHIMVGQALEEMKKHFHRIKTRINRGRKSLPIRLRRLDEIDPGLILLDRCLHPSDLEMDHQNVEREEQENRSVGSS